MINSKVVVEELELTGEDIAVNKIGLDLADDFNNYEIVIDHFHNMGMIKNNDIISRYNNKNMVFRGTKIINGVGFGIVIETGNDCQIYRIDNDVKKEKTFIQKKIVFVCILNLYLMLLISSFAGIIVYSKNLQLGYSNARLWGIVIKMILLFNTVVPLSLQFFFDIASRIISKRIEKKCGIKINRNGKMAFQIIPNKIVSDKTGTITTGEMIIEGIYNKSGNLLNNGLLKGKHLLNVLACSEVQVGDKNQLLKNDPIEELLLTKLLNNLNFKLLANDMACLAAA